MFHIEIANGCKFKSQSRESDEAHESRDIVASRAVVKEQDDASKNGIKPYIWGPVYWFMYHTLAARLPGTVSDAIVKFLFLSPRHMLPCVFCRQSFTLFTSSDTYQIDKYICSGKMRDFLYLMHNAVNHKLGKPTVPYASVAQFEHPDESTWERYFWFWLLTQAFNFPADLRFDEFLQGRRTSPFGTYTIDSELGRELRQRLRTYILLFDLIKYVIPRGYRLHRTWAARYLSNPPTPMTFASRANLLRWVYHMQNACGCREFSSLVQLLEYLHPLRSSMCHKTGSQTCQ